MITLMINRIVMSKSVPPRVGPAGPILAEKFAKIGPPGPLLLPKWVRPDQFWQPKLVLLYQFWSPCKNKFTTIAIASYS